MWHMRPRDLTEGLHMREFEGEVGRDSLSLFRNNIAASPEVAPTSAEGSAHPRVVCLQSMMEGKTPPSSRMHWFYCDFGSTLVNKPISSVGEHEELFPLSGPLRLRVQSQSRTQLRIAASIAFLFRVCFQGSFETAAPLSRSWAPKRFRTRRSRASACAWMREGVRQGLPIAISIAKGVL